MTIVHQGCPTQTIEILSSSSDAKVLGVLTVHGGDGGGGGCGGGSDKSCRASSTNSSEPRRESNPLTPPSRWPAPSLPASCGTLDNEEEARSECACRTVAAVVSLVVTVLAAALFSIVHLVDGGDSAAKKYAAAALVVSAAVLASVVAVRFCMHKSAAARGSAKQEGKDAMPTCEPCRDGKGSQGLDDASPILPVPTAPPMEALLSNSGNNNNNNNGNHSSCSNNYAWNDSPPRTCFASENLKEPPLPPRKPVPLRQREVLALQIVDADEPDELNLPTWMDEKQLWELKKQVKAASRAWACARRGTLESALQ